MDAHRLLAGLVLAAIAMVAAFGTGWRFGAGRVQGAWDAAELQRERAAQTLLAQDRRRAGAEAAQYEAQALRGRAQATALLPEVRHALQVPIPCPAEAAPRLGDISVPAGVLERLQRAGADPRAD